MGPRKDPWKLTNEDTPHANDDFASMLDASNINQHRLNKKNTLNLDRNPKVQKGKYPFL